MPTPVTALLWRTMIRSVPAWTGSTGGLTAGRVSPETALFPYITVDNIYDSNLHTGSRTVLRVEGGDGGRHQEGVSMEYYIIMVVVLVM